MLTVNTSTASSLLAAAMTVSVLGSCGHGEPDLSQPNPPPHLQSPQLAQLQQGLVEKEYQASRNRVGLQAPNRAHDLRTYFEASGIRVHDRRAEGNPELLSLSLSAAGRLEHMETVEPGVVESNGARVEIRRAGLVEWYVNSREGLEQGFTVEEEPVGKGPLVLEIAVEGAQASLHVDSVVFATGTGRPLVYGQLAALDAKGRALPAHFEVPEATRLRLVVEDRDAVYPVMIDPLLTATADAQLEGDGVNAYLGYRVAGAGDVNGDGYHDVIVGAYTYDAGEAGEGAAFVFLGSASGIMRWGNPENADAQLESNQEKARLGQSVAGAGDVNGDGYADVIVGARNYDFAPDANEGAAFVYLGAPACGDGIDNDDDGMLDLDDPGCKDNTGSLENPQCQDGANNDLGQDPNPGLIDFDGGQSIWGTCTGEPGGCPANVSDPEGDGVANPDPQCVGKPWKNQEKKSSSCGLGVELLLLAPLLWLWQRRRAREPF